MLSSNFQNKYKAELPRKPLNAYNLFFQYQRTKILQLGKTGEDCLAYKAEDSSDIKRNKIRLALKMAPAPRQMNGRRLHRKSHGKISFSDLSRHVSKLWHCTDGATREIFKELAKDDQDRYDRELCAAISTTREESEFLSPKSSELPEKNHDVGRCSVLEGKKRKNSSWTEEMCFDKAATYSSSKLNEGYFPVITHKYNDDIKRSRSSYQEPVAERKGLYLQIEDLELSQFLSDLDWDRL